jgi:hypothetical protein
MNGPADFSLHRQRSVEIEIPIGAIAVTVLDEPMGAYP